MFFWPIATTKVYCGNTDQLELPAQNIHLWPSGLAEECEGVEEMVERNEVGNKKGKKDSRLEIRAEGEM